MRLLSINSAARAAKLPCGGGRTQDVPRPGTKTRELYDQFLINRGRPIHIDNSGHQRAMVRVTYLVDAYGLDIRKANPGKRDALYVLVGEWFGSEYVSYV